VQNSSHVLCARNSKLLLQNPFEQQIQTYLCKERPTYCTHIHLMSR
jgi:hypothetical protein